MGDFDFGQFKEIYDYLLGKLNAGDALTPQEKQTYDMLVGFANQGLNLTQTGDFNSLYTAFNALADEGTKREFEKLYGTNFTQGENGQISFTQPGSVIEQFQRRGLSVNDGPVMAALTQGLRDYTDTLARNKFASMTNSYQAMTPIRGQNIQAATNAGNIAGQAAQRRVGAAGVAGSGGRRGSGGGEGDGKPIEVPIPPRPDQPSILERLAPDLIKLFGGGVLAAGQSGLLRDWFGKDPKKADNVSVTPGGASRILSQFGPDNKTDPLSKESSNTYDLSGNQQPGGDQGPYDINMQSFTGKSQPPPQVNPYDQAPDMQDIMSSGYQGNNVWQQNYNAPPPAPAPSYGLDSGSYYGMGSQGYQQPQQQPYDYSSYYEQPYQEPAYGYPPAYQDYSASYDYSPPSYDYSPPSYDYYPDSSTADYGGGWY